MYLFVVSTRTEKGALLIQSAIEAALTCVLRPDSVAQLQYMLNLCSLYVNELNSEFDARKSCFKLVGTLREILSIKQLERLAPN